MSPGARGRRGSAKNRAAVSVHLPVVEDQVSAALPADGRRIRIHPADVRGRFHAARVVVFLLLIALWTALPWIRVGSHPAVFVDVESHELFLFGTTFNPQDTWLLFFLLSGVGFGLVYATALVGRVWCGWACPQTVFLEGVYRRIERWFEGPREKRLRRNAGQMTLQKFARKVGTHAGYLVASLVIAHIVLAYFASIPKTLAMVRQSPSAHLEAFVWVLVVSAALYLNFAWFREQLCVVVCPYGRLQSALLDEHSLVVGYDVRRGEPRGKKSDSEAGDCVDCKRCVVVCPTGIDIRNGVQMECLACTACIDACDAIMVKLGRPPGLVRYDSLAGLSGEKRRVVRPRLAFYTGLLLVGAVVAVLATRHRTDFEATLLRLPGEPYTTEDGVVRDALQVHLVNKRDDRVAYRIDVDPVSGMTAVVPISLVTVEALAAVRLPVFLDVPRAVFRAEFPVRVRVTRTDPPGEPTSLSATFLGPAR
jgi:cytochrome c oxidase accessory protein FixG